MCRFDEGFGLQSSVWSCAIFKGIEHNCWLVRISYLIYSGCSEVFQRGGGEKNQDFMLIRFLNAGI